MPKEDLKDGHFRALRLLAYEVDRLSQRTPTLEAAMGGLGARTTLIEAELLQLRRLNVTLLTELRARGLKHLPEPEKAKDIRLSDAARLERRRELATRNRKLSKGRPRKKGSR